MASLRKTLFDLKYSEHVSEDSAPLVAHVLDDLIAARQQVQTLNYELDRTFQQKDSLQIQLEKLRVELSTVKKVNETQGITRSQMSAELNSAHKHADTLAYDYQMLLRQSETDKKYIQTLELKLNDLQRLWKISQDQVKDSQEESVRLSKLMENYRVLEQKHLSLERECSELRPLQRQWLQDREELHTLKDSFSRVSYENMKNSSDSQDKSHMIKIKDSEISDLKSMLGALKEENSKLNGIIEQHQTALHDKMLAQQRCKHLEEELNGATSRVEALSMSEQRLHREIEDLKFKNTRTWEEKVSADKQVERTLLMHEDLEKQFDNLQKSMEQAKMRENSLCSKIFESEEKLKQSAVKATDLEDRLNANSRENLRLRDEASSTLKAYKDSQDMVKSMHAEANSLKSAVGSLEQSNNDLSNRLEQARIENQEKRDAISSLKDETGFLSRKIVALDNEKTILANKNEDLARENNVQFHELQTHTKNIQELQNSLRNYQISQADLQRNLNLAEDAQKQLSYTVSLKEEEVYKLNDQIANQYKDLESAIQKADDYSHHVLYLQDHNKTLSNEIELVENRLKTTEKQYSHAMMQLEESQINEQNAVKRMHNLQESSDIALYKLRNTEDQLRGLEITKDDNRSLMMKNSTLESEYDRLMVTNENMHRTIQDLKNQVLNMDIEHNRLRDELSKTKHSLYRTESYAKELELSRSKY